MQTSIFLHSFSPLLDGLHFSFLYAYYIERYEMMSVSFLVLLEKNTARISFNLSCLISSILPPSSRASLKEFAVAGPSMS